MTMETSHKKPNPPEPPKRPRWSPAEYLDHVANRVPEYLQESAYFAIGTIEREWDAYESALDGWRGRMAAFEEARRAERGQA